MPHTNPGPRTDHRAHYAWLRTGEEFLQRRVWNSAGDFTRSDYRLPITDG